MEVNEVLHMKGGNGQESYASNSSLQKAVISITLPIIRKAMVDLCSSMDPPPTTLCMADLGCSSGPNTLLVVSELVKTVITTCNKLGRQSPEFQVYLNDLPGNDFNSVFKSLPSFLEEMRQKLGPSLGLCFFTGVPGSFYGRLFPTQSLHFIHSSYSLHWLSKVPEGVENNRGNIYITRSSPENVTIAYYEQFQRDFSLFLRSRSEELVAGGRMVLTFLGRESEDRFSRGSGFIWELLALALNQLVSEGLIEEEKMNTFNLPCYAPSPSEVKLEVEKEGSFAVHHLEVTTIHWSGCGGRSSAEAANTGHGVALCMRAVFESLIAHHFGDDIIDEVFLRYRDILSDSINTKKEKAEYYNVTLLLTKNYYPCVV